MDGDLNGATLALLDDVQRQCHRNNIKGLLKRENGIGGSTLSVTLLKPTHRDIFRHLKKRDWMERFIEALPASHECLDFQDSSSGSKDTLVRLQDVELKLSSFDSMESLCEEANSRFTVNALYLDLATRQPEDITGLALHDVYFGIVRLAGDVDCRLRHRPQLALGALELTCLHGFRLHADLFDGIASLQTTYPLMRNPTLVSHELDFLFKCFSPEAARITVRFLHFTGIPFKVSEAAVHNTDKLLSTEVLQLVSAELAPCVLIACALYDADYSAFLRSFDDLVVNSRRLESLATMFERLLNGKLSRQRDIVKCRDPLKRLLSMTWKAFRTKDVLAMRRRPVNALQPFSNDVPPQDPRKEEVVVPLMPLPRPLIAAPRLRASNPLLIPVPVFQADEV